MKCKSAIGQMILVLKYLLLQNRATLSVTRAPLAAFAALIVLSMASVVRGEESQESPEQLRAALVARDGAIGTFRGKVRVTVKGTEDRRRYADALRSFHKWVKTNRRELLPPHQPDSHDPGVIWENPLISHAFHWRYFWDSLGLIRAELPGLDAKGEPDTALEPVLRVFDGSQWNDFTPDSRLPNGPGELNIHPGGRRVSIPRLGIARRAGVPALFFTSRNLSVSPTASAIAEVGWMEMMELLPLESSAIVRLPTLDNNREVPVLQMMSKPWKDTGKGECRIRVWMDDSLGYLPIQMETAHLEWNRMDDTYYYLPELVIEWKSPTRVGTGDDFPGMAAIHQYSRFSVPVAGVNDSNMWPAESFEMQLEEFLWSDVLVNEPFASDLFSLTPPEGTSVVDEVTGSHYIVGSAGQQLRKRVFRKIRGSNVGREVAFWEAWQGR